ncbi:MAG: pyridoxamine 5'-phosphate oxidase family protein [Campylobacterales bacterium]|nr:pyridoxamine 5'-phosphate oxidase family protein [Campylobacterales bacterium]
MTTLEVNTFLEQFQTLMMASLTPEGEVHASTAPFVRQENDFYILISTIAQHGRNLLLSPKVSLFFAEDEAKTLQPFARKRITIEASVSEILREEGMFEAIITLFKEKFDSDLINSLSGMGDFHLFKLSTVSGSAVMGFGKAYRLNEKLEVMKQIVGHHQKGHGNG